MTLNYGLLDRTINAIYTILSSYKDKISKVSLFGSRAMGNYKDYSDIDLILY